MRRLLTRLLLPVALVLCGCGGTAGPAGGGGQPGGGGGQPASVPPAHGCGEPVDSAQDSREMSSWVHWDKSPFAGFAPDDKWSIVTSMSGVDVTAPLGVAGAGFGFVTNAVSQASPEQIEQQSLSGIGVTGVQIISRSEAVSFGGGTCQELEFTGATNGVPGHGRLAVIVYNDPATGFGYSVRSEMSREDSWTQYARTLQLISDHLTYQGRPAGAAG